MRRRLRGAVGAVVVQSAAQIRDLASALAPVDTSSLSESIYVASDAGSDYSGRVASAESVNSGVTILPEVETPPELQAVVAVAVGHGEAQELGTSRTGAQPYLTPAALASRDGFIRAVAQAVRDSIRG